ncbi:chromate transporter [Sphingomonas spermidinifaciens]|uniref:Chromate transporter n=1 Tax=Sphingomonas spermidinifaciens TaxID=1141889 RepID=A0A2A4B7W0_9SPHN|nr:chromate efflux transporter [Sphingomonas spermidinifaciens]PCD04167.1 chromate transporter [Sphingomonas spermidinifaciens]
MTIDPRPPALPLPQLFWRFLRFGLGAFGGPVAQIAMIREALVERERWIDGARFNRLLGVMQILPGPEAHELCVHMGMMARGRIGGLLAGLGFMLPGLALMMMAGALYVRLVEGRAGFEGVLLGVQAAVLGVIVRAVWRIGSHILTDRIAVGIAAMALAATLAGVPFWALLITAGLASALLTGCWVVVPVALVAVAGLFVPGNDPIGTAPVVTTTATLGTLFVAGLKGGLLTFGGAYTAIPYVRADTVGRGWLSDGAFLDGVAVAGLLPAPLVIFATFAGYVAGGPTGALAITAGMFLPAFAVSMIFFERLEAIVADPRLHRALDGVAAAVVGIIAATVIDLGIGTASRTPAPVATAAILAIACAAAWRLKGRWVTPAIVATGAVAGWLAIR